MYGSGCIGLAGVIFVFTEFVMLKTAYAVKTKILLNLIYRGIDDGLPVGHRDLQDSVHILSD